MFALPKFDIKYLKPRIENSFLFFPKYTAMVYLEKINSIKTDFNPRVLYMGENKMNCFCTIEYDLVIREDSWGVLEKCLDKGVGLEVMQSPTCIFNVDGDQLMGLLRTNGIALRNKTGRYDGAFQSGTASHNLLTIHFSDIEEVLPPPCPKINADRFEFLDFGEKDEITS